MTSLVQGLDNVTLRNRGENGQYQEGWSTRTFEEGITKLFYQLVRVDKKTGQDKLAALRNLYNDLVSAAASARDQRQINLLVSLLFQTRDISGGKGEYALFYELLTVWDTYMDMDNVAKIMEPMLTLLLDKDTANALHGLQQVHSYGSWKDLKYILEKIRTHKGLSTTQAVEHIYESRIASFLIEFAVSALKRADSGYSTNSLISRWLPREKSKFGWQAKVLADRLGRHTGRSSISKEAALKSYRQTVARLNKALGTVQINQCAGTWANIDFDKECTSITMARQKKAFVCAGSNKQATEIEDRQKCKENYTKYLDECKSGDKKIKAARTSPGDMVKAFWKGIPSEYARYNGMSQTDADTYNLMWKQQQENSGMALKNCVPILDTSGSMTWENCPLYDATAVALKIAESSNLGKRVMTFSNTPSWINLEDTTTLQEMVKAVVERSHDVGMSTNMQLAFQMVCDACVSKDITPEEVEDICLVVLSDMQANAGTYSVGTDILEDVVRNMFHEAGLRTTHARPYSPPTMVWWNMRTTNGAPCSTTSKNTVMMSGYDATVLSTVMESGIEELKKLTAWDNLKKLLEKERYSWAWGSHSY
jgi:hypothetical protein